MATGRKVLIVGGVAGGASAAARLRRLDEKAHIIMLERGGDVSFANCGLPYYIGEVIKERNKLLVQTPESLFARFNIDVRTFNEVTRIFPGTNEVEVKNLKTFEIYRESYDQLILSPGAQLVRPDIPGINFPNVFTIRTVPDSDRVKQFIEMEKPGNALVIGGGFIGLEMVENLKGKGLAVTVVEATDQVMAPLDKEMAALVHRHLRESEIDLRLQCKVVALEGDMRARRAILENGEHLEVDMVVLGIGVIPETGLANEAGLATGSTGGILADEYLRTSDPNIYAIGDAIQVRHFVGGQDVLIPLAGPANKQGRIVADIIAGRPARYNGTQGTAIAMVLGFTVAVTGVNEKILKKLGREYHTCYLHPACHATYYPGGEYLSIKLIFSPVEGKILGAQIVGQGCVAGRIDVIATAIRAGMTVYDLQELELAYAPQFSTAKDPVNMAGYVAANILNGDHRTFYWNEVAGLVSEGAVLLDVRFAAEVEQGMIPGAMHIPLDELRRRLDELPRDKDIYVYCQAGLRGYIAARILCQNGFTRVRNLSGGMETYMPVLDS
ncbi:MAG: FAD-dependent oxidoreductase [Smithellaceae bacterium]